MNGVVACPGCGLHFDFVVEDHYDLTQDISDDEQETFSSSSAIKGGEKEVQWTAKSTDEGYVSKRPKINPSEGTS